MAAAESTAEVVGRHVQAFLAGDIESIMADFADDALLCTPDGALRGPGPIRGFFEWALPLLPSDATTVEVKQQIVDGDVFYVAWSASSPAVAIPFAVDVFIVRDGKLAYQCFGGQVLPKQS